MNPSTTASLSINTLDLKKTAGIFRAVNHPLRQQMLHLIHKAGSLHVTEIYTRLKLEQSVASQHLAILRKAGFVKTERDGKLIHYSVNYSRLNEVQQTANNLLGKHGKPAVH